MIIGFMHYRKKPTNKAYAFAAVAKAEGAELLYFSPGMVDFQNKKIKGYLYRSGEWVNTISEFPDVVCNVIGFSSNKQNTIANKLRREIPFTSNSIGNKMTVYENLKKYQEAANYLIPSEKVESANHFFDLLDKYGEIVLKPSTGCQGSDVYYIKKKNSYYKMLSGAEKATCDHNQMSDFVSGKIGNEEYLIQPYINCRTKSGNAYDFRLHAQKNTDGKWISAKIYPRIAESGSIVCNICKGGYTSDLTAFLKREFGDDYFDIEKYIEQFSLQIAAHMDKIQKELYHNELDELGIDIGLDENQKIHLYEINWRPGYPPSINIDLNIIKNKIHYAMLLANRRG